MRLLVHRRSSLPFWVLLFVAFAPFHLFSQEIPLQHCDTLPVIEVTVGGKPRLFLIDTAANSMLNLESFTEGVSLDVHITSWSGTLATSAKEVTVRELNVGRTTLTSVKLPAIDLSAIGKACGRKIDGILGVDLLKKIGATVDLNRQILHVTTTEEARERELVSEMQRDTERCSRAFNESDEATFGDCLDPKIVLFTTTDELYGREKVIGYFRERYFHQAPAARLEIQESAFHAIGEAVWYEYEFTIDSTRGKLRGRGVAMCRKQDGHWRMASMHHTKLDFAPAGEPIAGR